MMIFFINFALAKSNNCLVIGTAVLRRAIFVLCAGWCLAGLYGSFTGDAAASVHIQIGLPEATSPTPIKTPARYAAIMDYASGEILYEKRGDVPTTPSSMSKLMTAAIAFELLEQGKLSLDSQFQVSKKAWSWQGSKMWVLVDTEIKLRDLLRGLIIQSGNDAGIVIAENIAGSEEAFATLMNQKAREWGLVNSTFVNATGWPDSGQKMSMIDLAILARKIIHDYPQYYQLFSEQEFTWSKITQGNRNPLLGAFDGADGLKTGHTDEAGYGIVGSAVRGNERRIIVINGLETSNARLREARRMMAIAFDEFKHTIFFRPGDEVAMAQVFKGKEKQVPLIMGEAADFIIHRDLVRKVKTRVLYEGPVVAPVLKDQQIGYLRVDIPGQEAKEFPLFAARAVDDLGWFGKIILAARTLLLKPEDLNPAETNDR